MPGSPNPVKDRVFIPTSRVPAGSKAAASLVAQGDAAVKSAKKGTIRVMPSVKFGR